jgi:hypothetical protein
MERYSFKVTLRAAVLARDAPEAISYVKAALPAVKTHVEITEVRLGQMRVSPEGAPEHPPEEKADEE